MRKYLRAIRSLLPKRYQAASYNRDYYRIIHKYDSLNAYLGLYRRCDAAGKRRTATGIRYRDGWHFGQSLKETVAELPPGGYKLFPHGHRKIRVVLYRSAIAGFRVKCQLHFFEDRLFLCSYTFSYLREEERQEILSALGRKYLAGGAYVQGQAIVDMQESCIYPEAGMELTLNYLWVCEAIRHSLEAQQALLERESEQKAREHSEELYNSL